MCFTNVFRTVLGHKYILVECSVIALCLPVMSKLPVINSCAINRTMIGMSIKRISVLNLCHVLKPFVKSTPEQYFSIFSFLNCVLSGILSKYYVSSTATKVAKLVMGKGVLCIEQVSLMFRGRLMNKSGPGVPPGLIGHVLAISFTCIFRHRCALEHLFNCSIIGNFRLF